MRIRTPLLLATALLALAAHAPAQDARPRGDTLGMNTAASPVYYANSFAFSDAANYATAWLDDSDLSHAFKDDSRGLDLPPGKTAQKMFFYGAEASAQIPAGTYVFKADGDFDVNVGGKDYRPAPNRIEVELGPNPVGNGVKVICYRSNPKDKLRNFSFTMPGSEDAKSAWSEPFVRNLRGSAILRTMQDQRIPEGLVSKWSDRGTPGNRPWSLHKDGVPVEASIELAGRVGSDLWLCVPHLADDDFVRKQATLVKRTAPKSMKVYVELDNEIWNYSYEVGRWQIGRWKDDEDPNDHDFFGQSSWLAWRSAEVFAIWEDVFGPADRGRIVEVIASQSVWPERGEWLLRKLREFRGGARPCDALAVAPYFYPSSAISGDYSELKPGADLESLMADLANQVKTTVPAEARRNRAVADAEGVSLIAYEAGQHLVCFGIGVTPEQRDAANALYIAANRDPRMRDVYRQYYASLHDGGFSYIVQFSQMGAFGPSGSWGQQESLFAPLADSPKAQARVMYQFDATRPIGPTMAPDVAPLMAKSPPPRRAARPGGIPPEVLRSMRMMGIPDPGKVGAVAPRRPASVPLKKAG